MEKRPPEPSTRLLQALAVCAELTQTELSKPAAAVMARDLARYPEDQVLGALERCRRELKPRQLTIASVVERLADGRPGPEEAWAMMPLDEAASAVWTDEMRFAMQVAWPLIKSGDLIPARMAFLENYRKLVASSRDMSLAPTWSFSPGTDKAGRELVLLDALEKKRISADYARVCLPYHREDEGLSARLIALAGQAQKALVSP